MNNRSNISLVLALMTAIGLLASCSRESAPTLTIIHTNDTHSQVEPFMENDHPRGGVVERAALLEMVRTEEDPDAIYLDAGDDVQGSPYYNIFKGQVEMECFNQMDLTASTFGNHEFDNGIAFLDSMIHWAKFPYLTCNYDVSRTVLGKNPNVRESIIIERKGVKIGITGVTVDPENLIFHRNWKGIMFLDPSIAANKVAAELKQQGCDMVILLSHVGYMAEDDEGDRYIAAQSKDIDLIIGGHTHTNIENGVTVNNTEGRPVMITQTGAKMMPIGRIKVVMEPSTRHKNCRWQVKEITCNKLHPEMYDLTPYGKAMTDLIQPYKDQLEEQMSVILGKVPQTLERAKPQGPLGNFTADALAEAGERVHGVKMDLGLMNYGGLRAPIAQGNVTIGDIYRTYPFENTLTLVELKGEYVQELIEKMAGKKLECLSSNTKVYLRTTDNKTVATRILIGGKPIDPERYYWIATIDYVAEGNDGMRSLTKARRTLNTGILLRDVMMQKILALTAAGRSVVATTDGRVVEE